jgi:hypothetical protein
MKKIYLFNLVAFLFCSFAFAQNSAGTNPPKKKEHYRFINDAGEDPLIYEKAMSKSAMDTLRFLNSRRHIPLVGSKIILELFSAQEMFEMYKKPISPFAIKNEATARKIKLRVNSQGAFEVVQ